MLRAILWTNGLVTVVDLEGKPVKEYQGMWPESLAKLLQAVDSKTHDVQFSIAQSGANREGMLVAFNVTVDEVRFLLQNGMRDEELMRAVTLVLQELRRVPNLIELPVAFTNSAEALRTVMRSRGRLS